MPRSSQIQLRLLGAFAIEANAGRTLGVAVRSRKARALIAYLAMTPHGRASREELATLLWGDTPDAQARHSLRQCIMSLRQDLHLVAPELIDGDRDTVELRMGDLTVDARELAALAGATAADTLARAAALWRGPFLADLALDIEEFAAWRSREQDRLAEAAARVLENLSAAADAAGDPAGALAAAERLTALDPTREDRARLALTLTARHRGREAALERARALTEILRSELAVAPDAATRALITEIRNGEIGPVAAATLAVVPSPQRGEGGEPSGLAFGKPKGELREPGEGRSLERIGSQLEPIDIEPLTPSRLRPSDYGGQALSSSSAEALAKADSGRGGAGSAGSVPVAAWRRRWPIAAALTLVSLGSLAALEVAAGVPIPWSGLPFVAQMPAGPGLARAVVLPFSVDAPRGADDDALASLLTHDLTADLARYGDLRIVADRTAALYPDRQADVAAIGRALDVTYAVVGRVQRTDAGLRAEVQLIDTASRMTLWSDHVQAGPDATALHADDMAHGLAHALTVNLVYARLQHLHRAPGEPPTIAELLLRARAAEMHSYRRESLAAALALYAEALRRAPHNATAKLGVARMTIVATMNFVDLDPPPDLARAEAMVNEVLERFPNWAAAHLTLGLLQKHRRQFDASLQSFRRSLELNPSLLPAQGQIGALLTRMGEPEKGLAAIRATIALATPNDPSLGILYLFAGEAELELGHAPAALDWVKRADSFMPGSALVQAWFASVYTTMGDRPNADKHIAALKKLAPAGAERFAARAANPAKGWPRTRIINGLRLALAPTSG